MESVITLGLLKLGLLGGHLIFLFVFFLESNKILNKNLFLILLFSIKATTTQYFIPLSITIWLYIKIGYIVSKQGIIAGQSTDERKRIQSEARKRRIIMLVLVGKKKQFL